MDKKDKDVYYSVWEVANSRTTQASIFSDADKDALRNREDFHLHQEGLKKQVAKKSKVSIYACLMVSITKVN